MKIEDYEEIIGKTAIFPKEIGIMYCALGICGEAGEIAEKIKKVYRDNHGVVTPETTQALKKEIGDVLWYLTALSHQLGFNMSEVMQVNYDKLIARRATNTLHGSGDNREENEALS